MSEDPDPKDTLRVVLHSPSSNESRSSVSFCQATDCKANTREGKPYCSNHIELSPYVKRVLKEIAQREAEAAALSDGYEVPKKGHLIKETLILLDQNSYTAARLSRLLDVDHCSAEALIRQMSRQELAKMGRTERGAIVIKGRYSE